MAGWLGSGSPESFIDCINRDELLPCHPTIDYDDPDWKANWLAGGSGEACRGALILAANMGKAPRDRDHPRAKPDKKAVFANSMEFVSHHREAMTQSWDDRDQSDEAKWLAHVFARAATAAGEPFKEPKKRGTR